MPLTASGPRIASVLLLAILGLSSSALGEPINYEARSKIPGHYTVGIYADKYGRSTELQVPSGDQSFDCFLGVTGDSMRVFSGVVFRLELPPGASLDGPIQWAPVEGLEQKESATDAGAIVEFNKTCISQPGQGPAIVGRLRIRMGPSLKTLDITPAPHRIFGLSVELCDDANAWPKPFAEPVTLHVTRKRSFWQRVRSWFRG